MTSRTTDRSDRLRYGWAVVALAASALACAPASSEQGSQPELVAEAREAVVVGGTTLADIETAITATPAGGTVYFPPGTYTINAPFQFKTGVAFKGDPANPAVIRSQGSGGLFFDQNVRDVTIANLHFDNVHLRFESNYSNTNLYFSNLTFKGGVNSGPPDNWGYDYLALSKVDGAVVDGCTFVRSGASKGGRGINLWRVSGSIIKNSFIGTTRDLISRAPGDPNGEGYFRTAINLNGGGEEGPVVWDLKVHNTVMRRIANPGVNESDHHGVYGLVYDGLELTDNFIDGWTRSDHEMAFKLRNADNTFVLRNRFMTSALLLIIYSHPRNTFFNHVAIRNNRIDLGLSGQTCSHDNCGIDYERNFGGNTPGFEDDIFVADNTFVDGGGVTIRRDAPYAAYEPEFCVENNSGAFSDFGSGVVTSGCVTPNAWDRPLAGVFEGRFNSDLITDVATRVRDAAGNWYWRVFLSNGDHHTLANWGYDVSPTNVWTADDTEKYGVHVADFTGDGRDDIVYYGKCGGDGHRCWRLHRSTGSAFVAQDFGDGVKASNDTFRFGVHVGDFDGDGRRDDLVYRGMCGSGAGSPCWRAHLSNNSTFTVSHFGDDTVAWDPAETDTFGLLIGNFDGDPAGTDDIAYRGLCTGGSPCWRVHLNDGDAFVYQSGWLQPSSFFKEPSITNHFGLRVGDRDGDGKADIGYRGKCGSNPSVPRWRYHLSTGSGFSVVCSDTYDF